MPSEMPDEIMNNESRNSPRILKSDHIAFFAVFKKVLGTNGTMTRQMRAEILNKWEKLKPLSSRHNLKTELSRFEKKYWDSMPPWSKHALTNKITQEHEDLKAKVMDEKAPMIRKAQAIGKLNEIVMKVNNLQDLPPPATILISTSANEDEMMKELNQEPIEEALIHDSDSASE